MSAVMAAPFPSGLKDFAKIMPAAGKSRSIGWRLKMQERNNHDARGRYVAGWSESGAIWPALAAPQPRHGSR